MALAGSRQTGFARKLLEHFDWWRFEPHPEWAAALSDDALNAKFTWGDWIWYPEGNPAVDAPAERRFFRKTFVLPERVRPATAILHISADDRFTAYVNGVRVASHHDWQTPQRYDVTCMHSGDNVLAVEAENVAANVPKNPAGLICCLQMTRAGGKLLAIRSDATWRCSRQESRGWESTAFDDHTWAAAKVAAKYGQPPGDASLRRTAAVRLRIGTSRYGPRDLCIAGMPIRVTKLEPSIDIGHSCSTR